MIANMNVIRIHIISVLYLVDGRHDSVCVCVCVCILQQCIINQSSDLQAGQTVMTR